VGRGAADEGRLNVRLAVFSDLHLCSSPMFERRVPSQDQLLELSRHLERTHDRIVLLGDILQTDYGRLPGSNAEQVTQVLTRYAQVVDRWRPPMYTWVYGNHDRVTRSILGALRQLQIEADGWKIWLIHGHQFDPWVGARSYPYGVTWWIGWLRRARLRWLADFLEGPFYAMCQRVTRFVNAADIAAARALLGNEYEVVCMGHTHRSACRRYGQGVYVNPGQCTAKRLGFASIDTGNHMVRLCRLVSASVVEVVARISDDAQRPG